jgi:hypothetical protein
VRSIAEVRAQKCKLLNLESYRNANYANRGESSRFWKGSCLPGQGAAEQAACIWQIRAKRSWCSVATVADRGVGGGELLINEASGVQACNKRLRHEAERKQMHEGMPARPCAINGHKRKVPRLDRHANAYVAFRVDPGKLATRPEAAWRVAEGQRASKVPTERPFDVDSIGTSPKALGAKCQRLKGVDKLDSSAGTTNTLPPCCPPCISNWHTLPIRCAAAIMSGYGGSCNAVTRHPGCVFVAQFRHYEVFLRVELLGQNCPERHTISARRRLLPLRRCRV